MRCRSFTFVLFALLANAQRPFSALNPSEQKEAIVGSQMARAFRQHVTELNNPDALAFIEHVAAKLAAKLPETAHSYTFALIEEDNDKLLHEPAAFPAGYIFVPASLLLEARDESELAGMLAHAMAHIALGHGLKEPTVSGWTGFSARPLASNKFVPASLMQDSPELERQADQLAVRISASAGFDADGLLRYLAREWPADAPDGAARDSRIRSMEKAIQTESPPRN